MILYASLNSILYSLLQNHYCFSLTKNIFQRASQNITLDLQILYNRLYKKDMQKSTNSCEPITNVVNA